MSTHELMTAGEVAEMMGVTRATIYQWSQKGEFPKARVINNRMRWRRSEIEEWIVSAPTVTTNTQSSDK